MRQRQLKAPRRTTSLRTSRRINWTAYYDEDVTDDSSNGSDSEDSGVTVTEKKTTDKTRVKGIREDKEELTPEENIKASQKVDAILVLDEKSLLERGYEASEIPESFWAKFTQKRLLKKQANIAEDATDEYDDVKVKYYYTIGLCGIGITTTYGNLEKLKELRQRQGRYPFPALRHAGR